MEQELSEKEEKKEYLWRYQRASKKVDQRAEELALLISMTYQSGKTNDGMPHGSSARKDLSWYMAEKERLEKKLDEETEKCMKIYREIMDCIEKLEDRERKVLFQRYIVADDWETIAKKMSICTRQVYRIHGNALKNLEISEKCQSMSVGCQ